MRRIAINSGLFAAYMAAVILFGAAQYAALEVRHPTADGDHGPFAGFFLVVVGAAMAIPLKRAWRERETIPREPAG